ncbi:MAG: 50S ribosomal protein L4 [Acidobacteria bacterium]|nr:50S ribosomal protein L4 [Acidobacteriota bacterium]
MPEVEVKNLENQVVEKLNLDDQVFGIEPNTGLIWEAVRHFLAAQRKGTASTKTRGEVSGSGKKLWRQKGTGRARIGSIRSPLWRHGGTVHGPRPRTYAYAFPEKKRRGALRGALSAKLQDGKLLVVDEFSLANHRTRSLAEVLARFDIQSTLLVVDSLRNRNLLLSSRNLPGVTLADLSSLNIHDVLYHDQLMFSKQAIQALQKTLKPS